MMSKQEPHTQVKNLVQSFRLKIKWKIKYDNLFTTSVSAQSQIKTTTSLGETGRWIIQKSADHCSKDKQSHLLKIAWSNNHKTVDLKALK